jgi:hypothetical protein
MSRMMKKTSPRLCALVLALPLLVFGSGAAFAQGSNFSDFQFAGTLAMEYSNGSYGTTHNTNVELGLPVLSMETGDFKFSASMPYMRISGRGLVIFDASGNPIVVNRRASNPSDVRTGFGDLNLSGTYSVPRQGAHRFRPPAPQHGRIRLRRQHRHLPSVRRLESVPDGWVSVGWPAHHVGAATLQHRLGVGRQQL